MFQPVCSEPSPSRSTTTRPFPVRTTNPGAVDSIQVVDGSQPVFSLAGAKSNAARGPSYSQALCGPPVNTQGVCVSKGSTIAGCVSPGGNTGPLASARAHGSPNIS